jgi:hypothetical protein
MPSFSPISWIGFLRASRAISMSDFTAMLSVSLGGWLAEFAPRL